jgi:type I restriction enzyme, S subunit
MSELLPRQPPEESRPTTIRLPLGWALTEIGVVGEVITGNTPSTLDIDNFGDAYPLVRPTELGHDHPVVAASVYLSAKGASLARLLPVGSVMVSCIGTLGKVGIAGRELATNQQINSIIYDPDLVNERYGFYFCQTLRQWMEANSSATTIAIINKSRFQKAPFVLAPLLTQRRIASELDAQFSRLEAATLALKRVQANLKRYRASVLKAACDGRLVPTEAELAHKQGRDYEPADKLLERILRERRARWEAETLARMTASGKPPKDDGWKQKYKAPSPPKITDLPSLPDGWCWASVDQVGMVQLGRQRSPEHHEGDHMTPYLRVANVFEDRVDTSDVNWMNFTPAERVTFGLREGDILLNEGQSLELIGRPAMYRNEIPGCCFQNTLVRFRPSESLDGTYALALFLAYFHSGRFQKIAKWTTNIAHLGALRFASLEFPLPPISEQHRIAVACEEVSSRAGHLRTALARELNHSSTLRRAILVDAFSGGLLPQDSNDEPASVLLERIRTERAVAATSQASATRKNRRMPVARMSGRGYA